MAAHKRAGRGRQASDKRRRTNGVPAESTDRVAVHSKAVEGSQTSDAFRSFQPPAPVSWGVASMLIICFLLQCLTGMAQQSATYDEPVYIAAGYSYIETGDFRLKQDAPPLVATLGGVALR